MKVIQRGITNRTEAFEASLSARETPFVFY
jgi:hypothetical protein